MFLKEEFADFSLFDVVSTIGRKKFEANKCFKYIWLLPTLDQGKSLLNNLEKRTVVMQRIDFKMERQTCGETTLKRSVRAPR